jgi:uncharacterized protein
MLTNSNLRNLHIARKNFSKATILLIMMVTCFFISCNLSAQPPSSPVGEKTKSLFDAIRSGSLDELNKQLANGADANDSLNGYSALMAAALNGTVGQMKTLINHGANVNYQTAQGITALWLAVPDEDKIILLLDYGTDINHQIDGYGILAKLAGMPGTINIFHFLIDKGADLKKSAADNFLLYNAAAAGDTSILGFLIRSGFKVNDTVAFGDYPINNALTFRSFATLKMLVDNGADVNVRPMSLPNFDALIGFTPLMNAALNYDKQSFFYLLEHGANPNLKNKKGFTALMLLQQSEATDDPEMTLALIDHGAVVTEKAPDGTDALYYAQRKGNTKTVEVLKKYSAKY